jgi:hypothetical protein
MQNSGVLFGECEVRIELAITLHAAGETTEAIDHLKQALDIAERLDLQPQQAKAREVLATLQETPTLET